MIGQMGLAVILASQAIQADAAAPVDVRVGIIAYEDFREELSNFDRLFSQLSSRSPDLHFQLAVGSYGEVLHWLDRHLIDVAVLTPGAFASLLPSGDRQSQPRGCRYLATVLLPAAQSQWASPRRRTDATHDACGSICLVAESSTLRSVADLRRAAQRGRVEFLFVHPLSVSGRAAPEQALRRAGIPVDSGHVRYSYSHSESIRMLPDRQPTRERIAFVWDDVSTKHPELERGVRRLDFPQLAEYATPNDVVVARSDFAGVERVQKLLLDWSAQMHLAVSVSLRIGGNAIRQCAHGWLP